MFLSCNFFDAKASSELKTGRMTDPRDGKTYKIVKIGNQTWMAENLNYETRDSYCYEDKESNCEKYGRLYTWSAAKNACPEGWHLSSIEEWDDLFYAIGGEVTAAQKLKSSSGWFKCENNGNNTDDFGFSLLSAGFYAKGQPNSGYVHEGSETLLWSTTEDGSSDVYYKNLFCSGVGMHQEEKDIISYRDFAVSVRCLQDYRKDRAKMKTKIEKPKMSTVKDSRDGKTYKTVKIGKQTWMAENLNYKMRDSYCNEDKESNCAKYGRLYTWSTAKKACLEGWHLPSIEEWEALFYVVGGYSAAGKKLKSTHGWKKNDDKSGNGTDDFKFSVLPARYEGLGADFWSYTNIDNYSVDFHYDVDFVDVGYVPSVSVDKKSVRCLKD